MNTITEEELGTRGLGLSLTTASIVYYAVCSSTMLVINKVAIHYLPVPSFLLFCQLGVSAFAVYSANTLGWVDASPLEWDKVKRFMWVVVGFLGTIYANMKVLQNTNVETFITFRSTTPLVLTLCDYLFLGRDLPNVRSWCCLGVLVIGSAGYLLTDEGFNSRAYSWLCCWYILFTFDTVYVKHVCENLRMTNWERVYYTNLLALVPLMIIFTASGDYVKLMQVAWNFQTVAPLLLSCVMGICMSHSGYLLRDTVSATFFTIVGIMCKVFTVIINCLLWDKHATPLGIGFLCIWYVLMVEMVDAFEGRGISRLDFARYSRPSSIILTIVKCMFWDTMVLMLQLLDGLADTTLLGIVHCDMVLVVV